MATPAATLCSDPWRDRAGPRRGLAWWLFVSLNPDGIAVNGLYCGRERTSSSS